MAATTKQTSLLGALRYVLNYLTVETIDYGIAKPFWNYFEKLKYKYTIKDSSLLSGEIEINNNPELATAPYLIGKTKYNYHVFKIIYDSNNEPYLLQAINFETDKVTMRKAIEQLSTDLQKN